MNGITPTFCRKDSLMKYHCIACHNPTVGILCSRCEEVYDGEHIVPAKENKADSTEEIEF